MTDTLPRRNLPDDRWGREIEKRLKRVEKTTDALSVNANTEARAKSGQNVNLVRNQERINEARAAMLVNIVYQYQVTADPTDPLDDNEWSEGQPEWVPGTYIWRRPIETYGDGSTRTGTPEIVTGNDGASAPVITLTATTQVLTSPASGGATTPATASISGSAINTTITTWEYSVDGAAFNPTLPTGVTRSGDIVTVTGATMTAATIAIRASDGVIADTLTVAKISDGAQGGAGTPGAPGADAITVLLTNESHTFAGDVNNALAGTASTDVLAFKGTTAQTVTVGTITGQVTGLTTSISGNNTTNPTITVTVTTALTATSGTLTVPVTVSGTAFTKLISWAVSRKGATGAQGIQGIQGIQGAQGAPGADASVIVLTATTQVLKSPASGGATTPATAVVTGTAVNTTINAWEYSVNGAAFTSTVPTGASRSGNVVTITGSTMTAATIAVRMSGGGVSDTLTVAKVFDGAQGATGATGGTGATGRGISSTDITYAKSTSGTTPPSTGWVASPIPVTTTGEFLWTRTIDTYTTGSPATTTSYSVAAHGATGAQGQQGVQGNTGAAGADAITVVLTNEAHTFAGDVNNALAGSAATQILAYKGATAQSITVGTITGQVTGLTTAITNNSTNSPTVTITVTTALVATSGTLTVPLTIDGKSITKLISWAVSRKGTQGNTGSTGAAGTSATAVNVGNDAVAIPTNSAGSTLAANAVVIPFSGWVGNARAAASVVVSGLPSGVTVTNNTAATTSADGSLTLTFASGSTLGGTSSGEITLTFTCNSLTFTRKFSWSKAFTGAQGATGNTGATGTSATSVDLGSEAHVIPTNSAGTTTSASTITIPFSAWIGNARAAATIAASGLPTGITVSSNTAGTTSAAGSLVLAVANSSTLGGTTSGTFTLTITANGIAFPRVFAWSKSMQGGQGATGNTGATGPTGRGISATEIRYQAGTSATTAPTGTWATTPPTVPAGQYLWTRTVYTYTTGSPATDTFYAVARQGVDGSNGATGATGAAGASVSSVTHYYQLATSAPAKPTASPPPSPWTTTEPSVTAGETRNLYVTVRTVLSTGAFSYTDVSVDAAFEASKAAYNLANTANTTANGKNKIVRSTAAASSPGNYVAGDQWWRYSGTQIIAMWLHTGSAWQSQTLTDSVITNLNAGTITTGFLNASNVTVGTSATGLRTQVDLTGIRTFNASNVETARLAADVGGLALTGSLTTVSGSEAATLGAGGLSLYNPAWGGGQVVSLNRSGLRSGRAGEPITFGHSAAGAGSDVVLTVTGSSNKIRMMGPVELQNGLPAAAERLHLLSAKTSGNQSITTDTAISGIGLNFTLSTATMFRLSALVRAYSSSTSDVLGLRIKDSGVTIAEWTKQANSATVATVQNHDVMIYLELAPGTHSLTLTAFRAAGSGTVTVAPTANGPIQLRAEEVVLT